MASPDDRLRLTNMIVTEAAKACVRLDDDTELAHRRVGEETLTSLELLQAERTLPSMSVADPAVQLTAHVVPVRHAVRVVSDAVARMDAVTKAVHSAMKSHGFRKRGRSLNRAAAPGLVHVINLQMGPSDPPGTVEIPGLRPNLYGQFAINVGVYVEGAWRLESIRFAVGQAPEPRAFINEYDCQIRHRVLDESGLSDYGWWLLDDPTAGERAASKLVTDVIPLFDGLATVASILEALEAAPPESREVSGVGGPDRLLAARIRLAEGDHDAAQRNFTDWVRSCRAEDAQPHMRHHLEFLAEFATEHRLVMPD